MQPFTCNISEMIWFCSMNLIQLTLLVTLVPRRYIGEETRSPGIDFYICQFSLLYIYFNWKSRGKTFVLKFLQLQSMWNSSGYCLNCKEYQLDSNKSKFIEKIHPEFHNSSDFESGITAETTMEERWYKFTPPPLSLSLPTNYVTGIWCYSTMN